MRQYDTAELEWELGMPASAWAETDLTVRVEHGDRAWTVRGFYKGDGRYAARFLPDEPGEYRYRTEGIVSTSGKVDVEPALPGRHGMLHAEGSAFAYADGTPFYPFGTTVYALAHQEKELIDTTIDSLAHAPFNKVRMCVFPKHYHYNHNEPDHYPFEKDEKGDWDVSRPCFAFWDALEERIRQLDALGIQADLILFHPYDRWGFNTLTREQNLMYLDYLLARLSAFPNVWWSLANEYDLTGKSDSEWEEIEEHVAAGDPYGHPLSNHNCFRFWDFSRPNVTHTSMQTKMFFCINDWRRQYGKPVLIDECCYEGNLPQAWGSISGMEMTARFWRTVVQGAYCTHGETFLDDNDVLWWAKGGVLKGESPARIAFLREITESLPGPIEGIDTALDQVRIMPEGERASIESPFLRAFLKLGDDMKLFTAAEPTYAGHVGDDAFLIYYDRRTPARDILRLPEGSCYKVDVIDTWNMTRTTVSESAVNGDEIELPGKENMALLAVRVSR